MSSIHTLSQLLLDSDNQYAIYDLGRRIQRIENTSFFQMEEGQQPYPFPVQHHAHFAVVYWNRQKQPWIWFLKFRLDERGLLPSQDIRYFINYIIQAIGIRLQNEQEAQRDPQDPSINCSSLNDNPYVFKPSEDKMAMLHSLVCVHLDLPPSHYYLHAQNYFSGQLGWDKWQSVGLQGTTDVCARLNHDENKRVIEQSLPLLPYQPLYALLGALEHISIAPPEISFVLKTMALKQIDHHEPDLFLLAALVRSLAGATHEVIADVIQPILNRSALSHQEILIAIAGRTWHVLRDPQLAELFLLRLAQTENQSLFNQLFVDLVSLPELRMVLLPLLHNEPSPEFSDALVRLQQI